MTKLKLKYQALVQRRRAKWLKAWAPTRAKGRRRFLVLSTLGFTVSMVAGEILRQQYWGKGFKVEELPLMLVVNFFVSWIASAIGWRECERAYHRYTNLQPDIKIEPTVPTTKHNQNS